MKMKFVNGFIFTFDLNMYSIILLLKYNRVMLSLDSLLLLKSPNVSNDEKTNKKETDLMAQR